MLIILVLLTIKKEANNEFKANKSYIVRFLSYW